MSTSPQGVVRFTGQWPSRQHRENRPISAPSAPESAGRQAARAASRGLTRDLDANVVRLQVYFLEKGINEDSCLSGKRRRSKNKTLFAWPYSLGQWRGIVSPPFYFCNGFYIIQFKSFGSAAFCNFGHFDRIKLRDQCQRLNKNDSAVAVAGFSLCGCSQPT